MKRAVCLEILACGLQIQIPSEEINNVQFFLYESGYGVGHVLEFYVNENTGANPIMLVIITLKL